MSPNRQPSVAPRRLTAEQEPFLVARALSTTYSSGYVLHPHTHQAHQLLFAASGAMTVTGDRTSWMIPPGRAVLIPAGIPHSIRMWGEVAMRSLYFPVNARAPVFDGKTCRVISVGPLLRELILRVAELAALDSRVAAEARLMSVLIDELETAHVEPLLLPLPADSRALKVAECVLKSPAEGSLQQPWRGSADSARGRSSVCSAPKPECDSPCGGRRRSCSSRCACWWKAGR